MSQSIDSRPIGTEGHPPARKGAADGTRDLEVAAFSHILAAHAARRRHSRPGFIGHVMMVNATVGAGGAERQLVNTAIGMQHAAMSGAALAGSHVCGPVEVCCRSLKSASARDFFLADLEDAGIRVFEYERFARHGGSTRHSILRPHLESVARFPASMRDGVEKLSDSLAYFGPDIVHLWQDSTIFSAAIAPVIAQVPRIVLSVRTMPPSDRKERHRPELRALYQGLVDLPGVTLMANSRSAAQRYAHWLDIDAARIPVIYNGLMPVTQEADAATRNLLAAFIARTADATHTLGAVMRFDTNKRPFLWLETAACILAREPRTRFILVGDGPLLEPAMRMVERMGIADRVLFVGLSRNIGFWLSAFDSFLLTSRFEGLPNVLIEAQYCGVSVLAMPAGGAAEAVLDGVSGTSYDEVANEDPRRLAEWTIAQRHRFGTRAGIIERARPWVETTFGMRRMIEETARLYMS